MFSKVTNCTKCYMIRAVIRERPFAFYGVGAGGWKTFSGLDIFSLATWSCHFICIYYNTYNRIYPVLDISFGQNSVLEFISITAVAGQRSSPDLCFATKFIKSIKFQTNIFKHAKYQLDPSTCSRDIDF